MKGWSGKSKILCIEQLGRAEKKTTKQKISQSSPSLCKYFPNIFLSPGYSKIFAAVFSKILFNWSPHFITSFSKPVRIPTESCENCSQSINQSINVYSFQQPHMIFQEKKAFTVAKLIISQASKSVNMHRNDKLSCVGWCDKLGILSTTDVEMVP